MKTITKTATKTATKAATKPATKPATKAATKAGAFASVYDALKACGITQRPNLAGHIAQGRLDKSGAVTSIGKAYFSTRLPDEQKTLSGYMAKAKADGFKTPSGFVFAPIAGGPVSHAPTNPGSYSASIVRAWFSLLVQSVK